MGADPAVEPAAIAETPTDRRQDVRARDESGRPTGGRSGAPSAALSRRGTGALLLLLRLLLLLVLVLMLVRRA